MILSDKRNKGDYVTWWCCRH